MPVVIGSRDAGRAAEAAENACASACPSAEVEGLQNEEAATRGSDRAAGGAIPQPVREPHQPEAVLREGQILVDATVPLAAAVSGKATRLLGVPQGSAAQQAAEMVPDGVNGGERPPHAWARPSSASSTTRSTRTCIVVGDSGEAKKRVAELIARIPGLRPVNGGRLEVARLVEGITPLLISVNSRYKTHAGIKLTGLPDELW